MISLLVALNLFSSPALANDPIALGEEGDRRAEEDSFVPPLLEEEDRQSIVNGSDALLEDYPMTGVLLMEGTITSFGSTQKIRSMICSSTLIAPDVVLLAAHCVDEAIVSPDAPIPDRILKWSRLVDQTQMESPSDAWPVDAIDVSDFIFHPNWDPARLQDFSTTEAKYDIALLFLSSPVTDVPYALLPTEAEGAQLNTGSVVDIVGWGIQSPIGLFDSFSPPEPGTFGIKKMGTSVIADLAQYEFQVGATAIDPRKCKGDSGGPTFMKVDSTNTETTRLIGVTSRAADNTLCESLGGYDTRVDAYLDWIDQELNARCADNTRVWCETEGLPTADYYDEAFGLNDQVGGCGCQSTPAPTGFAFWTFGLGVLALRRRQFIPSVFHR